MKKRNKKYKPKTVRVDAINWAIGGVFTIPIDIQKAKIKVAVDSFNLLREGRASRSDWDNVCQFMNIGEALCEVNILNDHLDEIHRGHEALHQVALRMLSGRSSTCYAHELSAIQEAIDMCKIQLRFCTQAEYSRAGKRVDSLLKGGAQKDVVKTYARLNGATK